MMRGYLQFAIVLPLFLRCSAVRQAHACAVSLGLWAPLVPTSEAPRCRGLARCARSRSVDYVDLVVVAHARVTIGVERQTACDSLLLCQFGAIGCNATVKFSLSSKAPSS